MSDDERLRRTALNAPGVGGLRRPVAPPDGRRGAVTDPATSGAESTEFPLHYVRTGPRTRTPVVVIPGGPGLASVVPYRTFRRRAAARGLDVLMVEHRGVGLSRRDVHDRDLPGDAMSVAAVVDDLAAVLSREGIPEAVVVGSSYGSYVAQAFASTHPDRVAGLILDSPVLSTDSRSRVADHSRALLFDGTVGDGATRALAARIRALVRAGKVGELELGNAARIVYEFAGPDTLRRLLAQLDAGRASRTRSMLARSTSTEITDTLPYFMESDLVGEIAFRELGYGQGSDGRIFDSAHSFLPVADQFSPFEGEGFDHEAALPTFDFPVLVLSGDRDLRTPRPVAERSVELAPVSRLVPIPDHGHSALDTHVEPLLAVAVGLAEAGSSADGRSGERLDEIATSALDAAHGRRRGGPSRHLGGVISLLLALDRIRVPRRPASGSRSSGTAGP